MLRSRGETTRTCHPEGQHAVQATLGNLTRDTPPVIVKAIPSPDGPMRQRFGVQRHLTSNSLR